MERYDQQEFRIPDTPGPLSKDEARAHTEAQIAYPNLARDPEKAERALKWVNDTVSHYADKMQGQWRRWRANAYMLLGNSLQTGMVDDLHVPEVYKMLETMVPRIEEAMLQYDPWFKVVGRDEMDREDAEGLGALFDWQLDQCKWQKMVQPLIRDALTYQIAVMHVGWDREVQERVRHEVVYEDGDGDGKGYWKHKRWKQEEVVFEGPRPMQVDPFDFLIDTRATEVEYASFVGHRSFHPGGYYKRLAELGLLDETAVDEMLDTEPQVNGQHRLDWNKWARSLTERYGAAGSNPKTQAKTYRCVTLYGLFDLYGDGREIEVQCTVGEEKHVLELRENVHDRKLRPYAVCRAAKNGHEFFNIGPLDNAVRINIEYDRHRMNVLRAHDLIVAPLTFVDLEGELPDNLYDATPGQVYKGVTGVTFQTIPNTLSAAPYIDSIMRRDIEETTGAPRIWEGSDTAAGSGTATEVERKVQEGNRRLRSVIRQFAQMHVDLLHIFHALNQQFQIGKTSFRVLGKRATLLGPYYELGPDTLMRDVDFEIVGVDTIHTLGSRATAGLTFLERMAPYLQAYAGKDEIMALLDDLYEAMVGRRLGDNIFRFRGNKADMMPQPMENRMLLAGQRVAVHPQDNDEQHLQALGPLLLRLQSDPDSFDRLAIAAILEHAQLHADQAERKRVQEEARQRDLQEQQQAQEQQASGPADRGGFEPARTPSGETPGPPRAAAVPSASRQRRGPVPQTENRAS